VARMLSAARSAEAAAADDLAGLERAAGEAETRAAELAHELEELTLRVAAQRAARLDRERWRGRIDSLRRQNALVEEDAARRHAAGEDRRVRVVGAEKAIDSSLEALPPLRLAADAARQALAIAELDAPDDEAEMAESARKLVTLEEARIDAR